MELGASRCDQCSFELFISPWLRASTEFLIVATRSLFESLFRVKRRAIITG